MYNCGPRVADPQDLKNYGTCVVKAVDLWHKRVEIQRRCCRMCGTVAPMWQTPRYEKLWNMRSGICGLVVQMWQTPKSEDCGSCVVGSVEAWPTRVELQPKWAAMCKIHGQGWQTPWSEELWNMRGGICRSVGRAC